MFRKLLLLLTLCTSFFAKTIEPRPEQQPVEVSVIIPCSGFHFNHLKTLLDCYRCQTSLPDEIVISLSSIEELNPTDIDNLEQSRWPFHLRILRSTGKQSAGLNRNIASDASTGDLLIYQDADDIPHPQRVEITKFIFENYFVDHLMHNFVFSEETTNRLYQKSEIPIVSFDSYDEIEQSPLFYGVIHNGNICCKREVYELIRWEDVKSLEYDLDVQFNRTAYEKFPNTALIPYPLVTYRRELSTFLHFFPNLYSP